MPGSLNISLKDSGLRRNDNKFMKHNTRSGFILLEAILTVVIVSICLTFIAQAILSNFRTGVRFQETVRSLLVMKNKLGLLYAANAPSEESVPGPQKLEKPYDAFTLSADVDTQNEHLKKVKLILDLPQGVKHRQLDVTTMITIPNENQPGS